MTSVILRERQRGSDLREGLVMRETEIRVVGFEDGGGATSQEPRWPLEAKKAWEAVSPLRASRRNQPGQYLDLKPRFRFLAPRRKENELVFQAPKFLRGVEEAIFEQSPECKD